MIETSTPSSEKYMRKKRPGSNIAFSQPTVNNGKGNWMGKLTKIAYFIIK